MSSRYLHLVRMDVAHDLEKTFNDVYDTEHLPLLSAVPGVHRATRFRNSSPTDPRYIAAYLIGPDRFTLAHVAGGHAGFERVAVPRWGVRHPEQGVLDHAGRGQLRRDVPQDGHLGHVQAAGQDRVRLSVPRHGRDHAGVLAELVADQPMHGLWLIGATDHVQPRTARLVGRRLPAGLLRRGCGGCLTHRTPPRVRVRW